MYRFVMDEYRTRDTVVVLEKRGEGESYGRCYELTVVRKRRFSSEQNAREAFQKAKEGKT